MDHLFWVLFNVLFAVFNGVFAKINYRKAQGRADRHAFWCLFHAVLALLCFGAAFIQVMIWLRS